MAIGININLSPRILLHFAADLIGNIGNGNKSSESEARFIQLINKHSGIINRICYSFAHSVDNFNDLKQDVLINLWRGIDSFRGDSSTVTWLYRIALNTCVSASRKESSRKEISLSEIIEHPECRDSENDHVVMLYEMIASLSFEERALILLWLDEMPYEEISEVMGYPRNTVAVKLHRIKEKLKNKLSKKITHDRPRT